MGVVRGPGIDVSDAAVRGSQIDADDKTRRHDGLRSKTSPQRHKEHKGNSKRRIAFNSLVFLLSVSFVFFVPLW
jgi:hypothetical protein